jgi:hypothetical protein
LLVTFKTTSNVLLVVKKVAEFLYDKKSTLPTWYKKHYEEKHRQNKAK